MSTSCSPIRLVPGPRGAAGTNGANGNPGTNAFTLLNTNFTMPAELGTAVASVISSEWMPLGSIVYLQNAGFMEVVATPTATSATLRNLKVTATGAYASNVAPGTIIASGSRITASGPQGPSGSSAAAGAPTDAQYWVRTAHAGLSSEIALDAVGNGLLLNSGGVPSVQDIGVLDTNVLIVDDASGSLVNGESLFATASGVESKSAALARTALGLGTLATQDANNVNITGGSITGVTGLSVTGNPRYVAIYQNRQNAGTNGGTFTQGSWQYVPLNTEYDPNGIGGFAAPKVTLASGNYRIRWQVTAYRVNGFITALFNDGTAAILANGSSAKSASTDDCTATSFGSVRLTLAGSTVIALMAYCATTGTNTGFGLPFSLVNEIYQELVIEMET